MSIDVLQEKIRKTKNPSVLELNLWPTDLPPQFEQTAAGLGDFCRLVLDQLKSIIPAVRFSFTVFALVDGLAELSKTMAYAAELGYYVILDAPEILSPNSANMTAEKLFGEKSQYCCDGLVISGYLGSDILKPFLPYCKKGKKDIFIVARTANKSAPELQDLLCGTRLVHTAAADHVNRYGVDTIGKCGYSGVGILAAASSAESLRTLRAKYPKLFFLLDGYDYPNANAKNCAFGFDKYGHGAIVCSGTGITCAWKKAETDGLNYLEQALFAAERMKKNVTRYITVL